MWKSYKKKLRDFVIVGMCLCLFPATGWTAPMADIKANGSDGPVSLTTSDTLSIKVSLNAGGNTNGADWWVLAHLPDGQWYYYNLSSGAFQSGMNVTYQGALFDLASYQVFNSSISAAGTYTFYFGVDMTADGVVTMGTIYYDSVEVNVSVGTTSTVTDIDGNVYNTVTIGTQTWMKEDLKTTKYNNGDAIGTTTADISTETSPKYQWAYNQDEGNAATYGRLYTWHAATDSRGLCPTGWRVPTDSDWTALTDYLGGESMAGGKMKESGTTYWYSPNTGADNSSGFTAFAGGWRDSDSMFYSLGYYGTWWSATDYYASYAWGRVLSYNSEDANRDGYSKYYGFCVRCVEDSSDGGVIDPTTGVQPCTYSISPTSQSFGASGNEYGTVMVDAVESRCLIQSWTAVSNAAWISSVWIGSLSNGDGPVYYYVEPNTGSAQRVGTITIANQTFTVTQAGSNPFQGTFSGGWGGTCNYDYISISQSGNFSMTIDSNGGVSGSYSGSDSGSISGSVSTGGSLSAQGTASGGVSWSGTFVSRGGTVSGAGAWTLTSLCSGTWATN